MTALVVGLTVVLAMPVRAGQGTTLVVTPARETIIGLVFDVARYHVIERVSCTTDGKGNYALYVWDGARRDWARITADDLATGRAFAKRPNRVIVIGSDQDIPREVLAGFSSAEQVKRIDTLDLVSVVNGMNEILRFPAAEWRYLASKYNLGIVDQNSERRRYGRWGKTDGQRPVPPPVSEQESFEMRPMTAMEPMDTMVAPPPELRVPEKGVPEKGVPVKVEGSVSESVTDTEFGGLDTNPEDK